MVSYTTNNTSSQTILKQDDHRSNHLHSVHQSSNKIMKKPLTSLAPSTTPQPKVYKVKPIHFRELVQKLTGAQQQQQQQQQQQLEVKSQPRPEARPQRRSNNLQIVAPPPLPLHPHHLQLQLQTQPSHSTEKQVQCKVEEEQEQKPFADKLQNGVGTTELILSPNFQAWFSFAMMSPGVGAPTNVS